MSHVTVMKGIVITDIAAFRSTVNELIQGGLRAELLENAQVRGHGSFDTERMGTCDFVLKLRDTTYDVGFKRNADGALEPVFDVYGERVGSQLGATHACEVPQGFEGQALRQLGKFSHTYAKHAALNQAAAEGYSVDCMTTDDKGNLQILLTVS